MLFGGLLGLLKFALLLIAAVLVVVAVTLVGLLLGVRRAATAGHLRAVAE
ncbi:hypothetical protein [Halorussus sp. MSC15.2]|nr:hypothetical protein [Halorussus sp. MSC15.2]NEU56850.1 hypothetical protein [Halorussus sp. MSC15.2]